MIGLSPDGTFIGLLLRFPLYFYWSFRRCTKEEHLSFMLLSIEISVSIHQ